MKVLHLSFHKGCINDFNYVCKQLNIECHILSSFAELNTNKDIDAINEPNAQHYNMTSERASKYWNKYKNYFDEFDCILTSDTAPLSRIFLQNGWNKKLLIWICNRFDFSHRPVIGGIFPDKAYFELLQHATNNPNVHIMGYTAFENYYAKLRGIETKNIVIKPTGGISEIYTNNSQTKAYLNNTIFIPPYHNDTKMVNLQIKLTQLGFESYCGKYNGPYDLCNYKAVVHIPYAWSNLAFFEMFQLGIVYFIPSLSFLKELMNRDFFWSHPLIVDKLDISEWYDPEHKDVLIYFNSWDDLKEKIHGLDFDDHKNKLTTFGAAHSSDMLSRWMRLFT